MRDDHRKLLQRVVVLKAAHILDDFERVGVDRVDMKQIVLHAADDVAELGQIAAEHAVAIHAPQLLCDFVGRAQQLQKLPRVAPIAAKVFIDQMRAVADQANRRGADAVDMFELVPSAQKFRAGPTAFFSNTLSLAASR